MFELYVNYFKWLCQLHPSLLHTDQQRVFELVSIEDAYADFSGRVSDTGFYFRLVDYSWGIGSQGAFEFQKKQGAFIVGKRFSASKEIATERIFARNQCETIVVDFLSHMVADSRNGHPLLAFGSDEITSLNANVQPLFNTGDGSYDGMICTFDFYPAREFELNCHPIDEWKTLSPSYYGGAWDLEYEGLSDWELNDGGDWQLNEEV